MNRKATRVLLAGTGLVVVVAVAVVLAVVLIGSGGGADILESPATGVALERSDGTSEGIQVHGHWTIEVRDPDGDLVMRREFDNALATGADQTLAELLGRERSIGNWTIELSHITGDYACENSTATPKACKLTEASSSIAANNVFKTLTLDVPTSGPNDDKLVLSGNATAQRDGTINQVRTFVYDCASSVAPSTPCTSGALIGLTSTDITSIGVLDGQQVLVNVIISFS